MNSEKVRDFYNDFSEKKLLNDFKKLNIRQQEIKNLCGKFLTKSDKVLEIGCGVGIITEYLSNKTSQVVAIDISDVNISLAKRFNNKTNASFYNLDIITQGDQLKSFGKFNVIILADVIEHIPQEMHGKLFEKIQMLLDHKGKVILTFPTPEYQAYLRKFDPEGLQIIDQDIYINDILVVCNLTPIYFKYLDMWGYNQYAHLVFGKDISFQNDRKKGVVEKVIYKIKNYLWKQKNKSFLKSLTK